MKKILLTQKKNVRHYTLILICLISIALIYSCNKKDFIRGLSYTQDEFFFKRNSNIKDAFSNINGSLADENLLNKTIKDFKDYDLENKIADDIKSKLGEPLWDISIVVKNNNKLKTIFTPLKNKNNKITGLLVFYQENNNKTLFKIINRKINQNKLKTYGNKESTIFTKASLEGIFGVADKYTNDVLLNKTTGTTTFGITINWICWSYNWAYTQADGIVVVGATQIQCTYSISYDYLSFQDTNADGGSMGGGGGSSSEPNPCILTQSDSALINDFNNLQFSDGDNDSQPNIDMEISTMPINSRRVKTYTSWIIGRGWSMGTGFNIVSNDISTQKTNTTGFWEFETFNHGKAHVETTISLGYSVDLIETASSAQVNPYLYQVNSSVAVTCSLLYKCLPGANISATVSGRKFYKITDGN